MPPNTAFAAAGARAWEAALLAPLAGRIMIMPRSRTQFRGRPRKEQTMTISVLVAALLLSALIACLVTLASRYSLKSLWSAVALTVAL